MTRTLTLTALALCACATTEVVIQPTPVHTAVADAAVPALVELSIAWADGGVAELRRVVRERFPSRTRDVDGAIVVGDLDSVDVIFVIDVRDIALCARDEKGAVVVDEPPRIVGCGAQGLSLLAAFVVAMEQTERTALIITDDTLPALLTLPRGASVWTQGGGLSKSAVGDVLDVELVAVGSVDLALRRSDGDVEALVVSLGRALSWRSQPHALTVLADRYAVLPRPLLERVFEMTTPQRTVYRERCRLSPMAESIDAPVVRCDVAPGRRAVDVRDDVLIAIADQHTSVMMTTQTAPSATSAHSPLARALMQHARASGLIAAPALRTTPSLCDVARARGHACMATVPLPLHDVERTENGAPDAVSVAALHALAVAVVAAVGEHTP